MTLDIEKFVGKGAVGSRAKVLRHLEDTKLGKYRDHEGRALTKPIIILSDKELFLAEKNQFEIC